MRRSAPALLLTLALFLVLGASAQAGSKHRAQGIGGYSAPYAHQDRAHHDRGHHKRNYGHGYRDYARGYRHRSPDRYRGYGQGYSRGHAYPHHGYGRYRHRGR